MGLISSFYSVTVIKNIPVLAGLGGGQERCIYFKILTKKKISRSIINKVESKIGSDLKLFFYNLGFLKNLRSIINLKKKSLFFVLIHPGVNCSTKEIYAGVKNYSRKKTLEKYRISTKSKFINYLSKSSNDLQSIVEKKISCYKKIIN